MAARGVNKVILVGNVGNDPDVRAAANGNSIVNISIATSEVWKDKNSGQAQEKTEWHRVVIFGKTAEIAAQYVRKGSKLYIEGKLQTRKWQDQSGNDRYSTEVVVDGFTGQLQFLDSKGSGDQQQSQQPQMQQQANPRATNSYAQARNNPAPQQASDDDFDDDIPF